MITDVFESPSLTRDRMTSIHSIAAMATGMRFTTFPFR